MASSLVLKVGNSVPIISACFPRYRLTSRHGKRSAVGVGRGPQFPEHLFCTVLMECTLIVTEVAVPPLAR
jgi:hypothetical protein